MKEIKKEMIVNRLEKDYDLYSKFEKFLKSEELNIDFVLYGDEAKYFDVIWSAFLKELKSMDEEDFYFVGIKLKCPHCNYEFGIEREYIGVITCPYCGKCVGGYKAYIRVN